MTETDKNSLDTHFLTGDQEDFEPSRYNNSEECVDESPNLELQNYVDEEPKKTSKNNVSEDLNHLSDSLELKLIAEAGATLISLKKLLTLSAGDIFDIADLPPKVNLVINNVVIGYGTLVEFNGRIGVKITSLVKNTLNINMTN